MSENQTVKVTLEIPKRDYDIIYKVSAVQNETINEMALRALKTCVVGDLCEPLGEALGMGESPCYDIFEEEGVQV